MDPGVRSHGKSRPSRVPMVQIWMLSKSGSWGIPHLRNFHATLWKLCRKFHKHDGRMNERKGKNYKPHGINARGIKTCYSTSFAIYWCYMPGKVEPTSWHLTTVRERCSGSACTINGTRKSFRQRATSLTLMSGCPCTFEGSLTTKHLGPLTYSTAQMIWAASRQNQQNECVPSKDSDQPGHRPSLIRVFTVRTATLLVLSRGGSFVILPL